MVNVHQLSADANTIRVEGVTMNRDVAIYLDCEPRERLEEFCKRFYRRNIIPTNLASYVWEFDKKGFIYPHRIDGDGYLVLYGFTDTPFGRVIKNYSETLKAIKLGEI